MRVVLAVLCVTVLFGCFPAKSDRVSRIVNGKVQSGGLPNSVVGDYPENYREIVKNAVRSTFFDPYSLRDVSVSRPVCGQVVEKYGWVVCLRANGKNKFGAYTGLSGTAFIINHGKVIGVEGGSFGDMVCFNSDFNFKYSSWPELVRGGK